jgi:hypothetical protein
MRNFALRGRNVHYAYREDRFFELDARAAGCDTAIVIHCGVAVADVNPEVPS